MLFLYAFHCAFGFENQNSVVTLLVTIFPLYCTDSNYLSVCFLNFQIDSKCIKAYIHQGRALQNLERFDEVKSYLLHSFLL